MGGHSLKIMFIHDRRQTGAQGVTVASPLVRSQHAGNGDGLATAPLQLLLPPRTAVHAIHKDGDDIVREIREAAGRRSFQSQDPAGQEPERPNAVDGHLFVVAAGRDDGFQQSTEDVRATLAFIRAAPGIREVLHARVPQGRGDLRHEDGRVDPHGEDAVPEGQ